MTTTNLLEANMRVRELFDFPSSTMSNQGTGQSTKDLASIDEKASEATETKKYKLKQVHPKNLTKVTRQPITITAKINGQQKMGSKGLF